ncbi:hypothetical protein OBP_096 [Pseudomonas phage OBP]|uniref:hypothetical protein n=1 Tax=Pseudomonas phage OBP TaxID=1124849 RepID=UPI000240D43E|nr:hypothetical protein OBP_096 [Pseudomonas phage OBP]AEV89533.1 hypothetical protein OBP_096 [Pseudomonas phage OBP]
MADITDDFFSVTEDSFKELLKDKVAGIDERKLVHLIKGIRKQSYFGESMFKDPAFGQGERCKVVYQAVPNPLTAEQFHEQSNIKVPYTDLLDAFVIPLWVPNQCNAVQARLAICTPRYGDHVIAVQVRYGFKQNVWATIYCDTQTVKIAIRSILR